MKHEINKASYGRGSREEGKVKRGQRGKERERCRFYLSRAVTVLLANWSVCSLEHLLLQNRILSANGDISYVFWYDVILLSSVWRSCSFHGFPFRSSGVLSPIGKGKQFTDLFHCYKLLLLSTVKGVRRFPRKKATKSFLDLNLVHILIYFLTFHFRFHEINSLFNLEN